MKIIIPALNEDCLAGIALRAEGLEPAVKILDDFKDYAKLIQKCWREHETFIVVEHDIVPWPGAMKKLWQCNHDWCGHSYPLHARGIFGGYLGCTKFSQELIIQNPKVTQWLGGEPWINVDSILFTRLRKITGHEYFHLHMPPVAHVRDLPLESERRTRIPGTLPPYNL